MFLSTFVRDQWLNIIYYRNNPDLTYRDGQDPIVHLQFDMHAMVSWAESNDNRRWAFSDRNAGAYVVSFFKDLEQLHKVNWPAVKSDDFRSPQIKEGKQAEFLVYDFVPWTLVEKIGVIDRKVAGSVTDKLIGAERQPNISIEKTWYF